MTTRYTQEHYEDVARVLKDSRASVVGEGLGRIRNTTLADLAGVFADLFAADSPPACIDCGARYGTTDSDPNCVSHLYAYGFDKRRFLAACGLKTEPDILTELEEKADHWEEGYPHGRD